ncbi:MAG: hypothetical protein ABIG96_00190, partial [Candidatus Micrarchaeota archaeon]
QSAQGGRAPVADAGMTERLCIRLQKPLFLSRKKKALGFKKKGHFIGKSKKGFAASGVGEFNSHSPLLISFQR